MCGIVGISFADPHAEVAPYIEHGLFALQHRGQDSASILVTDNDRGFRFYGNTGLVRDIFTEERFQHLKGCQGIGFVRYATEGAAIQDNAYPPVGCFKDSPYRRRNFALVSNGQLNFHEGLRTECRSKGYVFRSETDTEVIAGLLETAPGPDFRQAFLSVLSRLHGAFSVLALYEQELYAARSRFGIRPLVWGARKEGIVFASETRALDLLDADYCGEVAPGAYISVKNGVVTGSAEWDESPKAAPCVFERVYFSSPDSIVDGRSVKEIREEMGRELAREHPVEADLVISVPDSSTSAAIGYAHELGIRFDSEVLLRTHHYKKRSFIEQASGRLRVGHSKHNVIARLVKDRRIIVVDDSIVRNDTFPRIIARLQKAGAREIHGRIASPPVQARCPFGIAISSKRELVATYKTPDQIAKELGIASLKHLSLSGMLKAAKLPFFQSCHGCFSGMYPTAVPPDPADMPH